MLEKFSLRQNVSFDCNFMMAFIRILNYQHKGCINVCLHKASACLQATFTRFIDSDETICNKKGFGYFNFFFKFAKFCNKGKL